MSAPRFDEERWRRLASYMGRARAKPTWDLEEREPKKLIVARFREAIDAADGPELPARIARLEPAIKNRFAVLRPDDFDWLKEWAAADPPSLAGGLRAFARDEADAEARFEAWAAACARAAEAGHAARNDDAALAVGSLFNFATEPARLPIVSQRAPSISTAWAGQDEEEPRGEAAFAWLEAELGYAGERSGALAGRYASHVRFAQLVHARLLDEGVPVADMVDVQSLIVIAALERDFWAVDPPADLEPPGRRGGDRPYLALCAIYRDEAPYLAEWIEFHRVVGVERFFLYDNRSSDSHAEVLAPYVRDGIVVVHDWPQFPGQIEAYDHCLAEHRSDARWIAFIDLDEFLFSPGLQPLPELLRGFEEYPAVGVNRATFGTSGHRRRPDGLVIESYVRSDRSNRSVNRYLKSIVQPALTVRCVNAHRFLYRYRLAVDENGYPIHRDATKSVSFERLRINHYYTRSEEELRAKHEALRADYAQSRPGSWEAVLDRLAEEHDDSMAPYVPRVRAALGRAPG